MSEFGAALRRLRIGAGLSQQTLARRCDLTQSALSRLESGSREPHPTLTRRFDEALHAGGELVRLLGAQQPDPWPVAPPDEGPVTGEYVQQIHDDIARLVRLDGQHGGVDLVPMASRLFGKAAARMANPGCSRSLRVDFAAATAELGEVAGWLAFDAADYDRARALSNAALRVAGQAGDRPMELFLLGNQALVDSESGHPEVAERTARYMQSYALSPRLEAMTWMRQARALADMGDARAIGAIRRARQLLYEGVREDDPPWAWWINEREVVLHEAGIHRKVGSLDRAVSCYVQAWESYPQDYRWGRLLGATNLADVLVQSRQFVQAEQVARQAWSLAWEVTSVRAARRLEGAARRASALRAPEGLVEQLTGAYQQACH